MVRRYRSGSSTLGYVKRAFAFFLHMRMPCHGSVRCSSCGCVPSETLWGKALAIMTQWQMTPGLRSNWCGIVRTHLVTFIHRQGCGSRDQQRCDEPADGRHISCRCRVSRTAGLDAALQHVYAVSDATLCMFNWFWVGLHTSQRSSVHTLMLMRGCKHDASCC